MLIQIHSHGLKSDFSSLKILLEEDKVVISLPTATNDLSPTRRTHVAPITAISQTQLCVPCSLFFRAGDNGKMLGTGTKRPT